MHLVGQKILDAQHHLHPEHSFKAVTNLNGSSLAVQWLEHCALTAEGLGSISGLRTKIL